MLCTCRRELSPAVGLILKRLCSTTRSSTATYSACAKPRSSTVDARRSGRVSPRRNSTTVRVVGNAELLECSETVAEDCRDVMVVPEFVSEEEGEGLLQEISRTLRGKRYLYNHWDGAIEGYRETEKTQWREENVAVVQRLKTVAETVTVTEGRMEVRALDEVHVLDLAKDGFIKPHIDSVKFCGDVIAGLSLLSPCVMVFQHETDPSQWIRALLPPLSLYVMRGVVRYNYTHAIPLKEEESWFKGQSIARDQRISVISRTHPPQNKD